MITNANDMVLLTHQLSTEDLTALQISICNALEHELTANGTPIAIMQWGNVQLVRLLLSTITK